MDYVFFRICKILKLKSNRYLILLSSSYVIIVFGTKTLTNSLEMALVSLLLWKVIDSMTISEKVRMCYCNEHFNFLHFVLGFSS